MKFELYLGYRYLRGKKRYPAASLVTMITISGVAIGVTALVTVISVMAGFDLELKEKILGNSSHIRVTNPDGMENYEDLADKISEFEFVTGTAPYVQGQAYAISRSASEGRGVIVMGIDPASQEKVTDFNETLKNDYAGGELGEGYSVVLGSSVQRDLGVAIGGEIRLMLPIFTASPFGPKLLPAKRFTVTGISHAGKFDVDNEQIYIPLETAQKIYNLGDAVTGLQIMTTDAERVGEFKWSLLPVVPASCYVMTWFDMNRTFIQALGQEKAIMFVIQVLVVVVAAFNIIATLSMLVIEKTRDIGILRAMGASKGKIMRIFVLAGLLTGLTGATLGMIGGYALTKSLNPLADFIGDVTGFRLFDPEIYYFDRIPAVIVPADIAIIAAAAVIASLLATLYPAYQASRLDPIEAIRYE